MPLDKARRMWDDAYYQLKKGLRMREYLVEYGAHGWRDWVTVRADSERAALDTVRENYPLARWAVVEDDVTGLTDDN